jgi:hypothetical protein
MSFYNYSKFTISPLMINAVTEHKHHEIQEAIVESSYPCCIIKTPKLLMEYLPKTTKNGKPFNVIGNKSISLVTMKSLFIFWTIVKERLMHAAFSLKNNKDQDNYDCLVRVIYNLKNNIQLTDCVLETDINLFNSSIVHAIIVLNILLKNIQPDGSLVLSDEEKHNMLSVKFKEIREEYNVCNFNYGKTIFVNNCPHYLKKELIQIKKIQLNKLKSIKEEEDQFNKYRLLHGIPDDESDAAPISTLLSDLKEIEEEIESRKNAYNKLYKLEDTLKDTDIYILKQVANYEPCMRDIREKLKDVKLTNKPFSFKDINCTKELDEKCEQENEHVKKDASNLDTKSFIIGEKAFKIFVNDNKDFLKKVVSELPFKCYPMKIPKVVRQYMSFLYNDKCKVVDSFDIIQSVTVIYGLTSGSIVDIIKDYIKDEDLINDISKCTNFQEENRKNDLCELYEQDLKHKLAKYIIIMEQLIMNNICLLMILISHLEKKIHDIDIVEEFFKSKKLKNMDMWKLFKVDYLLTNKYDLNEVHEDNEDIPDNVKEKCVIYNKRFAL